MVSPPIVAWSKKFFNKTLIFEHNQQWNNTKFKIGAKKNSHSCVPLKKKKGAQAWDMCECVTEFYTQFKPVWAGHGQTT